MRKSLLFGATVAVVAWAASAHFNVANTITVFARSHERWQLDEFFTLIDLLSLAARLRRVESGAKERR